MHLTCLSVSCILLLSTLALTSGYSGLPQRERRSPRKPCSITCPEGKKRLVCGSDGLTYPSKCELRRAKKCEGKKKLSFVSKGACPEKTPHTKCLKERESAKNSNLRGNGMALVQECNPDGSFKAIQYHPGTGYYYCVDENGKPIAGTSSDREIKACKSQGYYDDSSSPKPKKDCGPAERNTFNKVLIELFSKEFAVIPKPSPSKFDVLGIFPDGLPIRAEEKSSPISPEKKVIEWKFSELDNDQDDTLKSRELRSLKKMVRKMVKPKSCAKTFVSNCDLNNDGGIKRDEWSTCLGVDFKNDDNFQASNGGPTLRNRQMGGLHTKKRKDSVEREHDNEDKIQTCEEERKAAEEKNKSEPAGKVFIPYCKDGKYRKEQCHDLTGYCWCVDANSGRPIPGTATLKMMPQCNGARPGGKRTTTLKGCPEHKKQKFLVELLDTLTAEMMAYLSNASSEDKKMHELNPDHSFEERVVRWKLVMLDKNNNKVIDKKEKRAFKSDIRKTKSLRKCGRNFDKYCDKDGNKKITVEELVSCMGINDKDDPIGDEPAARLPFRHRPKGQNPFKT